MILIWYKRVRLGPSLAPEAADQWLRHSCCSVYRAKPELYASLKLRQDEETVLHATCNSPAWTLSVHDTANTSASSQNTRAQMRTQQLCRCHKHPASGKLLPFHQTVFLRGWLRLKTAPFLMQAVANCFRCTSFMSILHDLLTP